MLGKHQVQSSIFPLIEKMMTLIDALIRVDFVTDMNEDRGI